MKILKSENQNYNAWLHWDVTKRCNLNCEYCFGKITDANIKVHSIDIPKLITTLNKTGNTFRISFTGGEPTLVPNFVEACLVIAKKHFISFNSNLISKSILDFAKSIKPNRVLHIHASLHYDELIKNNLLNRFALNYKILKDNGFNIYAEAVAHPKIKSRLKEVLDFANINSMSLSFAPFYGVANGKNYPESYSQEELELFKIAKSEISCFMQKGKLCNAGYNVAVVFSNGNIYPCHQIKTKIGNIYEGFKFANKMTNCPSKKCGCPLNKYDEYLFKQTTFENLKLFSNDLIEGKNQPPIHV